MVFGFFGVVEYNDFFIFVCKGKVVRIYVWYFYCLIYVLQIIREEGFFVVFYGVYQLYYVFGGVVVFDDLQYFCLLGF